MSLLSKLMLFTVIFCLRSILFSLSFAETVYFDFLPSPFYVLSTGEVNMEMKYDLDGVSEESFAVRPEASSAKVFIWDEKKEGWVSDNALWSELPSLTPKMRIKISGFTGEKIKLKFKVQDRRLRKVFEAPAREVWGRQILESYVKKLNENVMGEEEGKVLKEDQESLVPGTVSNSSSLEGVSISKKLLPFFLGVFGLSGILGFALKQKGTAIKTDLINTLMIE